MAKPRNDPLDLLDDMDPNLPNSGRQRNMRRLLRRHFEEEFGPKRVRIRPVKGKELIALISVAALVFFAISFTESFNIFVKMEETVLSANGLIMNTLQRRSDLFSTLINLTLNQAALEQEVFRHVADVRKTMMGKKLGEPNKSPAKAESTDADTGGAQNQKIANKTADITPMNSTAAMARLLAVVERYPEIRSSATYQQLMNKLVEIEDRIIARRIEYNEAVRKYNTFITTFPWYIMADITGFKIYKYSTPDQISEDENFHLQDLASSLFQRLLPLGSGNKESPQIPEKTATSAPKSTTPTTHTVPVDVPHWRRSPTTP